MPWGFANILRDTKTTGSRPSPGKYRFAMTGYWLGATDLGFPPDISQLDWLVRTKNPYYWPEAMEPITDDDIAIFAAELETVAEGVARGDYLPDGPRHQSMQILPVPWLLWALPAIPRRSPMPNNWHRCKVCEHPHISATLITVVKPNKREFEHRPVCHVRLDVRRPRRDRL